MIRTLTTFDFDALLGEASCSPRRRAIYRLHEHEEPVQRMLNAMLPGTYVQPHKHEAPDKVELFCILVGQVAVLEFDAAGNVESVTRLSAYGVQRIAEIAPRTYHTLIPLEKAVLLEIIEGPYDAQTHKKPAPWAPEEDNSQAADYRMVLESLVHKWRSA